MSHLGPLISPLIDGQLPPAKAERALAHVATCPQCRAEVAEERAWRATARAAGGVRPSDDLTARLLALQIPGQSRGPVGPRLDASTLAGAGGPGTGAGADATPVTGAASVAGAASVSGAAGRAPAGHPLRTRVLTGAVASLGVFALALFVVGEQPRRVDDLTPLVDAGGSLTGAANHADTATTGTSAATSSEDQPGTDWIIESGWAAPDELPAGMVIQDVGLLPPAPETGEVLQVTLTTTGTSRQLTVLEQHGVLDAAMLAPLEPTQVGGHTVYLVSGDWWVVQCADSVVAVSSGADADDAHAFIEQLPCAGDSMLDRLAGSLSGLITAP